MNTIYLKYLFPIGLILTGIIHLIPSRILLDPDYIKEIYGIENMDGSIKIIILHRASFFLFLSIFSIISAFIPSFHDFAFLFCSFSISSFIVIFYLNPIDNPQLYRVYKIDILLLGILLVSFFIEKINRI